MPTTKPKQKPSAKQSVKPSAKTSAKQSAKTSAKQSAKTSTKQSAKTSAKQSAKTSAKQSAKTSAKQPALLVAMTGRASNAKAADGDAPVFAYIASLPQPQRGIAERVDALAAATLPDLQRAVKWGIAWYGVGDGWCFCCGGFVGHVKLTFGHGTSLDPVPPITPIGMGKTSRGVDLASLDAIDEPQIAAWMRQATAIPGFGKKR